MARARNIKPGFFKNEDLAECTPWARLCFAGLWTLADREGRLEDRPKRIKGELFPFDTIEVEPLLQELARFKFIERYETDGMKAIQIVEFGRHQTPHYSEKPSVIKPHGLQESEPHQAGGDSKNTPRVEPASRGGRNPLNPDSLNPESPLPPAKRGRVSGSVHEFPPGFDTFWEAYPRKVGKPSAGKAFARLKPDDDLQRAMLAALTRHRDAWRGTDQRFIPHPATWLNDERWRDEASANLDPFEGAA